MECTGRPNVQARIAILRRSAPCAGDWLPIAPQELIPLLTANATLAGPILDRSFPRLQCLQVYPCVVLRCTRTSQGERQDDEDSGVMIQLDLKASGFTKHELGPENCWRGLHPAL